MIKKSGISSIFGLQVFQVLRFVSFLIISIVFTKSTLSQKDIGDFELLLFIASAISFFWITGIIQSLLPLFNNNTSYVFRRHPALRKSPELFNAFLLILFISILLGLIFYFSRDFIEVYNNNEPLPYIGFLIAYLILSSPACLIEYFYMLYNKPQRILIYGFVSFVLQTLAVIVPVVLGYGLVAGIWGLVIVAALRFVFLLVLVFRYADLKFSPAFMREHLGLAWPLIISTLLSGSAQYIDGLLVSMHFSPEKFAVFRYGAKEMPLVITLASGLNNAMLTQFSQADRIQHSLLTLKKKSLRLMHFLFPISIMLMLFADRIFPAMFTKSFGQSSSVFMVYMLLIMSRLVFPQTILVGLKKTRTLMVVSLFEIVFNVVLTLLMIPDYGIVGVAVATVIVFSVSKIILIGYNYYKLKIKPWRYIPVTWFLVYSIIITTIFVLIDHQILVMRLP